MQAAEQSNDSIQFLVDLIIWKLLEPFFELIIAVESYVMWGSLAIIHEILEWLVSILLEFHIIVKSLFYQLIHLVLKLKELSCKLKGVF